jgi:putative transposase
MAHRYKVIHGGPYPHLVTCTIVRWLPVFVSGPYFAVITDSLTHIRQNRDVAIHAYVIMPTHIHVILTALRDDLSDVMRDFKKFTSRAIYQCAEGEGNKLLTWLFRKAAEGHQPARFKVWDDEFHPQMIYSEDVFLQKAEYIHLNPVRKGLTDEAERWHYSSAGAYADHPGPVGVDLAEW